MPGTVPGVVSITSARALVAAALSGFLLNKRDGSL
jgi:hypothetical protein